MSLIVKKFLDTLLQLVLVTLHEKINNLIVYEFASAHSFKEVGTKKGIGLNGHASADKRHKVTNIQTPSEKLNVKSLEQAMKEFFNPLKRTVKKFQPPLNKSQNIFDSPHLSTTPYCWITND